MKRDFTIYTAVLALGLGLAYYVSLPKNEKASAQTEWLSINPATVEKIVFKNDNGSVEVSRADASSKGFFATLESTPPATSPLPDVGPAPESAGSERFRLNKKFDETLASFNPFYVLRVIGKADGLKLEEFGLDKTTGSLTVIASGKTVLDLKLGKKAYGSRNVFVIDQVKSQVLLVNGDALEDLEKAKQRLFLRDVFDFTFDEVASVNLVVGSQEKKISHSKRDASGGLSWTDEGSDKQNASYKNFMTQVEKVAVQRYARESEDAQLATASPLAKIVFFKANGTQVGELKLFKLINGTETTYWVYSTYLAAYAQVVNARAEGLEKDLPAIMGK